MSIFDKYDLVDVDESVLIPEMPESGVTCIIGTSGSGKSTILKEWGHSEVAYNEDTPIYQLFDSEETAEEHLIMFGLRTVPAWKRSLKELSNGERQRAIFALNYSKGIFFCDEFTSLVDRDTARSLCNSINRAKPKRLVVATCHKDIADMLNHDHLYDCDKKEWRALRQGRVGRSISIEIRPVKTKEAWAIFGKHHYLSGKINKSSTTYAAFIDGKAVAMTSFIAFPNGNFSNGWREHRTVVLPEFQGMGIGNALSEWIANKIVSNGGRFFSKTSHPSMGEHRERSANWKPTSKNRVIRNDYKTTTAKTKEDGHKMKHLHRNCYSHEYDLL